MNTRPDVSWHEPFLVALETSGNVRKACKAVGILRGLAYEHQKRALADAEDHPDAAAYSELRPYGDFHVRWDEALENYLDLIEEVVSEEAVTSKDLRAAIFILTHRRRHIYGNQTRIELGNADGKPFESTTTIQTTASAELAQWMAEENQKLREALARGEPPPIENA